MRALRNAVLAYGLFNVPVGVCTATRKHSVSFKTLHRDCGGTIRQQMLCTKCEQTLESSDTVKGYEVTKGHIVEVDPDTLDDLTGSSSEVVTIEKFVPGEQMDELQVCDSYLLQPTQKHPFFVQAYAQLSKAMGPNVIGLGMSHLWAKEMPSAVWAKENGVLVLSRLYCWEDVVDDSEIEEMLAVEIPDQQMELADLLVAASMRDLDPEQDLISPGREQVENYLAALVAGEEFKIEREPEREIVVMDMEEMLQKSIDFARGA